MKKIFLLFSLASIILFSSCSHKNEQVEEEEEFLVTSPLQADTTIYKEYVSQIRSASHIELRSQEKGYLQNIYVDEGEYVRKGQLMFKLMPMVYEAEVEKAKAELNYTEIEYKNTKSLADKNIVSPNELALSKAKLDKAKAELTLAQAHLGFTEIRAPFNGYMDRFYTRLGSLVEEGELLTTLSDNSKMWVYFNVSEAEYLDYMKQLKNGNKQRVMLQLANKEMYDLSGVVETIEADFNNETGNIAFRAAFSNPKSILRHGETGTILMPVSLKGAVLIPQKATFDVLDKKYVYVVDKDNILQAKQIIISHELPHLYIVSTGLNPGDKILAEGIGKVKNKEKIKYKFVSFEKELAELNKLHAE
ncbi:MAG: hypothetical protein RL634_2112 [Bacteroidota bacterium]|jgi:membrane fusion protein, multidrug efflux system